MNSYNRAYAVIDLDAVGSNVRTMRDSLPPTTSMIGVVKTDGYEYGAVPAAKTIDPYVGGYAVTATDGAVILRRHGIQKMILILGVIHKSRFGDLVRYDIRSTMFRYEEAGKLSEAVVKSDVRTSIHLAVDAGISRAGMTLDEASADEVARITRLLGIRIEGMSTHLARADEANKEFYEAQCKKYRDLCEVLHNRGVDIPTRHCSNSAGVVERLDFNELDMVCAGVFIYGPYPSDEVVRDRVELVPAMELKSAIIYIEAIEPDTSVGCDGTFVTDRPVRTATTPVGYEDGHPRNLSNKGMVLIRGRRAGVLERMCTDQFMADVVDIPEAAEGDQMTLIGKDGEEYITVEELTRMGGGFRYEIICGIGKWVPRVYLRDGEAIG